MSDALSLPDHLERVGHALTASELSKYWGVAYHLVRAGDSRPHPQLQNWICSAVLPKERGGLVAADVEYRPTKSACEICKLDCSSLVQVPKLPTMELFRVPAAVGFCRASVGEYNIGSRK
jgi:hypothetical protein